MVLKWLVPVAGMALAASAAAQDYTPAPQLIQGEITQSDEASAGGRRYDEYPVELVRGQRILVTAAPAAGSRVVPGIEIYPYGAPAPISLRPGDADSRNTQLLFTAPTSGVFTVRIVSGSPAAGRYTLAIRQALASSPGRSFSAPSIGAAPLPIPNPGDSGGGSGAASGPRSRFIICPGHPRCPR